MNRDRTHSLPGQGRGNYMGTVIDQTWWKRYRAGSFGWRGNGEYWFDDTKLIFRKMLSRGPIEIPLRAVTGVDLVTKHAGKWMAGRPIVRIDWTGPGGEALSSGICVGTRESADQLSAELRKRSNLASSTAER
jgi:hypothetical protein